MTKFYVDAQGAYIGGFDGADPPEGAIEVPGAPARATDTWDGSVWHAPLDTASAIAKTYRDVDDVFDAAIGRRGTEYADAETAARAFVAANYEGVASDYVADFALSNPTGTVQTDQWAADQIIARADAFRAAQLAMRSTRFARQADMRAATTPAELAAAVVAWDGFIAAIRVQLGL